MRCKPWHAELLADRRAIVYFAILQHPRDRETFHVKRWGAMSQPE
jgi:hypothetical protein